MQQTLSSLIREATALDAEAEQVAAGTVRRELRPGDR
jgi:hypothetical protein